MSNPPELKQTEGRGQKSKRTGSERGHRKGTEHTARRAETLSLTHTHSVPYVAHVTEMWTILS